MDTDELLSRFAVALGIGLLIGLERGWRTRDEKSGSRAAGFRTFAISGLLGGIVGALARTVDGTATLGAGAVVGIAFATFSAVVTIFCLEENRADKTYSATTAVAAILTFALGAYALLGDMRVAAAVAVVTAGLLALRESLHGWVKSLTWPELRSVLILLAMTFIALPIVPDDPVGPFGGVNPREVWLIAIALAGISFLGYGAVKYFGVRRGVLLAAAAGGLVSSTAVTLASARRAAAGEGAPQLLAAGVAVAAAISFLRVVAIVAFLKPSLLALLGPPLVVAALVSAGFAFFRVYGVDEAGEQANTKFRNPFSFWSVVVLALTMGLIILVGRFLNQTFGSTGVIAGAGALGLFDVDAVTVSITRLVPQPLGLRDGTFAILIAVASNTVSKLAISAGVGRGRFAVDIAMMSALAAAAGLMALWLTLLFAGIG
jgi:uncharacterized membrane protein (DUF4010 family)